MSVGFGRYVLEGRLGEGGLFEAFLASSPGVEGFSKGVLVKRLRLPIQAQPELVARFVDSARRAVALSHAHLAQVIDVGAAVDDEGRERHFVVTEVVRGLTLEQILELRRSRGLELPAGVVLRVAAEVARVLDHVHRKRSGGRALVHAGIAPRNVFVTHEGLVKVTDACLHEHALHAQALPELVERWRPHRAPEEREGAEPSQAGDLWSLGALLETALGAEPTSGSDASATRLQNARPELPSAVIAAVSELCAELPGARGSDAAAWHERLLGLAYAVDGEREPRVLVQNARAELASPEAPPAGTPRPIDVLGQGREVTALLVRGVAARSAGPELERRGAHLVDAGTDLTEQFALFGLTEPDGRDVEAAVDAGLSLLAADASLSIGVEVGRVAVDPARPELAAPGPALDQLRERAARHAELPSGSLGVSRRVAALVRSSHLVAEGQHGLRRRTVVGQRPQARALTRFQGRGSELRAIGAAFLASTGGKPAWVRLVGAPGVGKSRLVAELARRLARSEQPALVAVVPLPRVRRSAPFEGLNAAVMAILDFGAHWAELDALRRDEGRNRLRALGLDTSEVEALLPGARAQAGEPAGVVAAFTRLVDLVTCERPLLLAWDDAQSLDPESRRVIGGLVAPASERRLLILESGRELPELASGTPIEVLHVQLGELDDDATARLLAAAVGARVLPPDVFEEPTAITCGNPLLVEELVRELLDAAALVVEDGTLRSRPQARGTLPRTLRAVAEARLSRLGADASALVRAAASLGADSSASTLAEVAAVSGERSTAALVEALEAGALERVPGATVERQDRFRISALVGDLVLSGLLPADLTPLYERALHIVERGAEASPRALSALAAHAEGLGLRAEAAALHARSAAQAVAGGSYDLAAGAATRALSLAVDLASSLVLELLELLVVIGERTASLPDLAEELPVVLGSVDAQGEPELSRKARVLCARALAATGATESAEVVLAQIEPTDAPVHELSLAKLSVALSSGDVRRALELVDELDPARVALDERALLLLADLYSRADKLEAAFHSVEAARKLVQGERSEAMLAVLRGRLRAQAGDPRGALPQLERALELARADDLPQERALALVELGRACAEAGESLRALGVFVAARDEAAQRGLSRLELLARGHVAHLEAAVRGADAARGELEAACSQAEAAGYVDEALELGLLVAERGLARGEPTVAEQLVARAARLGQSRVLARARRLAQRAS